MYAVIVTGGKQHKVKEGDTIQVELLEGGPGDKVTFQPILVVDDSGATHFGKDAGKAVVTARLVGETKGDKVKVFKYKPKTGYSRHQGHRQSLSVLEIEGVSMGPKRAPAKAKAEAESSEGEEEQG